MSDDTELRRLKMRWRKTCTLPPFPGICPKCRKGKVEIKHLDLAGSALFLCTNAKKCYWPLDTLKPEEYMGESNLDFFMDYKEAKKRFYGNGRKSSCEKSEQKSGDKTKKVKVPETTSKATETAHVPIKTNSEESSVEASIISQTSQSQASISQISQSQCTSFSVDETSESFDVDLLNSEKIEEDWIKETSGQPLESPPLIKETSGQPLESPLKETSGRPLESPLKEPSGQPLESPPVIQCDTRKEEHEEITESQTQDQQTSSTPKCIINSEGVISTPENSSSNEKTSKTALTETAEVPIERIPFNIIPMEEVNPEERELITEDFPQEILSPSREPPPVFHYPLSKVKETTPHPPVVQSGQSSMVDFVNDNQFFEKILGHSGNEGDKSHEESQPQASSFCNLNSPPKKVSTVVLPGEVPDHTIFKRPEVKFPRCPVNMSNLSSPDYQSMAEANGKRVYKGFMSKKKQAEEPKDDEAATAAEQPKLFVRFGKEQKIKKLFLKKEKKDRALQSKKKREEEKMAKASLELEEKKKAEAASKEEEEKMEKNKNPKNMAQISKEEQEILDDLFKLADELPDF